MEADEADEEGGPCRGFDRVKVRGMWECAGGARDGCGGLGWRVGG